MMKAILLLSLFASASAFSKLPNSFRKTSYKSLHMSIEEFAPMSNILLSAERSPLESYIYFWSDLYKTLDLSLPEPLIHW